MRVPTVNILLPIAAAMVIALALRKIVQRRASRASAAEAADIMRAAENWIGSDDFWAWAEDAEDRS